MQIEDRYTLCSFHVNERPSGWETQPLTLKESSLMLVMIQTPTSPSEQNSKYVQSQLIV